MEHKPAIQIPNRQKFQDDEAEMLHRQMMAQKQLEDVVGSPRYNEIPQKRQYNNWNNGGGPVPEM